MEKSMSNESHKAPRFIVWLLKKMVRFDDFDFAIGDLEEMYEKRIRQSGSFTARCWLYMDVLKSLPGFIKNSIYWRIGMLKNYLVIAFRNIHKHKGYSLINVAGLALGLACCLLILLWVMDELSYDRFHENSEHLYRIEKDMYYSGSVYHSDVTPCPLAPSLVAEIPETEGTARYYNPSTLLLRNGDKTFFESGVKAVDPSFLGMFTFPLIRGDAESALDNPHSLVISGEIAEKYFGDANPLGKSISINNAYEFTVTGVLQSLPHNTCMQFDMLVPFEFLRELGKYSDYWGDHYITTFVKLNENAVVPDVTEKITQLSHHRMADMYRHDAEELHRFNEEPRDEFELMPVADIHLHADSAYGQAAGKIQHVYIFTMIAIFVLMIACINFMNLATARSANRAREVGIRKVVGAFKRHIIGQFYAESVVLSYTALVLALILISLLLPYFNMLTGKTLIFEDIFTREFVIGMIAITLFAGIVSGSYPALFLSSFQPVKVIKGTLSSGVKRSSFRKILVIVQFSLSIMLIIGTAVVYRQLHFMRNKKLGYDTQHIIYVDLRGDTRQYYTELKQELRRDQRIVNVTGTGHQPNYIGSKTASVDWEGKDANSRVFVSKTGVDFDYVETMGIEMAEGRPFSKAFASDASTGFLVNEEVVKIMGVESAVGKRFNFGSVNGTIVGVMKNYHFWPVQNAIEPLALYISPKGIYYMVIRLSEGDIPASLAYVKATWNRIVPGYPFDYKFMDEDFDGMYRSEERMGNLLQLFTVLAILIACLGLFGLASFTAEQRTKEIGVRKVLGATLPGVILLLSKEFTKWVIISNVIAWPVGYFVLKNWLQGFAYRTPMSWWIFVGSGMLALVVALLTVSYQSLRAALANPVEALKYE